MVLIMVTGWVPHDKAEDASKKYIEAVQKFPLASYEKGLVVGGSRATKEGFKIIAITGVKKDKYNEALEVVLRRQEIIGEIKGYKFEIETLMSVRSILEYWGMKMPQ